MKRFLILFLSTVIIVGTSYAQDFWTGSVWNGMLGAFVPNVQNFDWSSSGSGNAQGIGPTGTPLVVGTTFDFRYQSYLFALNAPDGSVVPFPNLNANFEYTVVAKVPEVVSSFTNLAPGVSSATLTTLPGGVFYIYYDASPNVDVATGMGFDDGILVASGTIDPDQLSSFVYDDGTGTGLGSTILFGKVNYANPAYLNPAPTIVGLRVEGTLNYPPLDSSTTAYFKSRAAEGNLPDYTVASNDLPFKVDTSSKFLEEFQCCIDIEKYVSVDPPTNPNWYDADICGEVPVQLAPHNAMYKLVVTNCGNATLTNVTISDSTLGINQPVTNLAPGEVREFKGTEIPELGWEERCTTATTIENTAVVNATCSDPVQTPVSDQDSACWQCKEQFGQCRMTHGSATVNQDGTFSIEGPYAETQQPNNGGGGKKGSWKTTSAPWYTVGGQIGAPQANNPSYGEWEHQQHNHPTYGSFGFHAGTASASPGTEISSVMCADPGWCENARCAPFKQIFWDGVGEFENMSLNNPFPGCTVKQKSHKQGGTLHYFKAHASDFGEPGGNFPPGDGPQPSEALCSWVSGGTDINNVNFIGDINGVPPPPPGPLHGDKGSQACDECPDHYEIEIHCTTDPNSPIIYQVHDFIDRGNIQIHPEVGQQCPY